MSHKLDSNFKLIKDGLLDMDFFKSIFDDIEWVRAPRKLNEEVSDFWHIGKHSLDDGKIEITIKVSPDKWMRITENQIAVYKTTGGMKDWGASAEVFIGDNLFHKIKENAVELTPTQTQRVDL